MAVVMNALKNIDAKLAGSTFGRVFRLEGSGHPKERNGSKFSTEIRAGLTTFFTMSYIIAVNASILTQSGGTCVCNDAIDKACVNDADYNSCLIELTRDLTTATSAIAGISTFFFGFLTNLPVALAPGMGMNAYFTYQVVGYHGTGNISYRLALTAVFIEGFIFLFLSLIGMRQWLVKLIPSSIKVASGVGIGLFLTEIGLSYSGIGLISGNIDTPLDVAGCEARYLDAMGHCGSHKMMNPSLWIGVLGGGILTAYLMAYRVKSAIIIGIIVVSILSWPRNTSFTYFPHTPAGDEMFAFFRQIIAFHPISSTLSVQDWSITGAISPHFALALFTFLYVDIIDATATLYSMARFSGVVDPESGDFPRSTLAYCVDAASISIGSLLGVSPVTAFIESGAGIAEGGKTGLTAIVTAACFLLSIFFAPIFASIPPWATGCTLVLVGCMMMRQIIHVNWRFVGDAIPAFVTIVCMPFMYSVAYGLIAGLFVYTVLNGAIYATRKISGLVLGKGREIEPPDADLGEYWTWKVGGRKPWVFRVFRTGWWTGAEHEHVRVDDGVKEVGEEGEGRSVGGTESSEKELVEITARKSGGGEGRKSTNAPRTSAASAVGSGRVSYGAGGGQERESRDKGKGRERMSESEVQRTLPNMPAPLVVDRSRFSE